MDKVEQDGYKTVAVDNSAIVSTQADETDAIVTDGNKHFETNADQNSDEPVTQYQQANPKNNDTDVKPKKITKTLAEVMHLVLGPSDEKTSLHHVSPQQSSSQPSPKQRSIQTKVSRRLHIYKQNIERCKLVIVAKMVEFGIPGISVEVSYAGNAVWSEAFGYSDVENAVPCKTNTVMRIASISKSVSASTVTANLLESGDLNLDDSIYNYISEDVFPKPVYNDQAYDITIKQLLNHTSGIKHYDDDGLKFTRPVASGGSLRLLQCDDQFYRTEFFQRNAYRNVYDSLSMFKNEPLYSKPGDQFHYTTYGYTLLSAVLDSALCKRECRKQLEKTEAKKKSNPSADTTDVNSDVDQQKSPLISKNDVERLNKMPKDKMIQVLEAFLNHLKLRSPNARSLQFEDVWINLLRKDWDLTHTYLDHDEPLILHRSRFYKRDGSSTTLINVPYADNSFKWAGGGLLSDCHDLVKFGQKLIDSYKSREGALIKKETIELLWSESVVNRDRHYGLGFDVETRKECAQQTSQNVAGKFWNKAVSHSGNANGASSMIYILPETEIVVAILANLSEINFRLEAAQIADIIEEDIATTLGL